MYLDKKNKEEVQFPDSPIYPRKTIQRVQSELLKMASCVTEILEKHEIPYLIAYGTLIGAIKFKGFLPWDDDIDFFLFDESYDEAIRYLEEEMPPELLVHGEKNDPNYFLAWNSVKNLEVEVQDNGIYNPDNKLLKFRCLGLDLYRLKKVSGSNLLKYKKDEARKFFKRKLEAKIIDQNCYQESVENLETLDAGSDLLDVQGDLDYYTFVVKMKQPILPEAIFPLKRYRFEHLELLGPSDPMQVLSSSFDSLEELPPYEERKPHLSAVNFRT